MARIQSCRIKDPFSSTLLRINSVLVVSIIFAIIVGSYVTNVFETAINKSPTFDGGHMGRISSVVGIPVCKQNLLDAREYDFTKLVGQLNDQHLLIAAHDSSTCRLVDYSQELTVKCFDSKNRLTTIRNPSATYLQHFVFIGDSRIRQQFYNFLSFIPDYDRIITPSRVPRHFKGDIEVTSDVLQVRVSFKWQPLVNTELLQVIREIVSMKQLPLWILFGIQVHSMLREYDISYLDYIKGLEGIALYLEKLGALTKVIWLNQYPSIDDNMIGYEPISNPIYSERIQFYNEGVRQTLKPYTNIHLWDSSNKWAEEYIRSCKILERNTDGGDDYGAWYVANCFQYLHTGNIAVREATQILLNDYCNHDLDSNVI